MIEEFHVVPGGAISSIMPTFRARAIEIVRDTYLKHDTGHTVNPHSYFLTFDDKPTARIIALPAAIKGERPISGLKWIGSYPENVHRNIQRASAVLILNDYVTGYPIACLEASQISAARTAASAVMAARALGDGVGSDVARIAFVGAGVIARSVVDFFADDGWHFEEVRVHDIDPLSAEHLIDHTTGKFTCPVLRSHSVREAILGTDIVVLATTASTPYIDDEELFVPGQIILNISLRDISPDIILSSTNIFDDIEHCLKANTSPHLAEQKSGRRSFAHGTIAGVMRGICTPDASRPIIFSPFGLGVLDIALGKAVLSEAKARGLSLEVSNFFPAIQRW